MVPARNNWTITPDKVLSQEELDLVLDDLQSKTTRSRYTANALLNLTIVRLCGFAGLRASEAAGLKIKDVVLLPQANRSHIKVSAKIAKMGKARTAMIWSENTVRDLERWKATRIAQGAKPNEPFICSLHGKSSGQTLTRQALRLKTKTACKVLGKERVSSITCHSLRHTFISKALADGVPLALVRDSVGHCSISITNTYVHVYSHAKATWSMDSHS